MKDNEKDDGAALLPGDPISKVKTEPLPVTLFERIMFVFYSEEDDDDPNDDRMVSAAVREALRIAKVNIEALARNCVNQHRGAYADVIAVLDDLSAQIGSGAEPLSEASPLSAQERERPKDSR